MSSYIIAMCCSAKILGRLKCFLSFKKTKTDCWWPVWSGHHDACRGKPLLCPKHQISWRNGLVLPPGHTGHNPRTTSCHLLCQTFLHFAWFMGKTQNPHMIHFITLFSKMILIKGCMIEGQDQMLLYQTKIIVRSYDCMLNWNVSQDDMIGVWLVNVFVLVVYIDGKCFFKLFCLTQDMVLLWPLSMSKSSSIHEINILLKIMCYMCKLWR